MSNFISVIVFFITTIFYYIVLFPKLTITNINNLSNGYNSSKYKSLASYFLLVLVSQIAINTYLLLNSCGGSITHNLGYSFLLTFIPWFVIFGIVIIALIIYPGFKSAFSNVIGYYLVASTANNLLSKILINSDLDSTIDNSTIENPDTKKNLKETADVMLKMFGNLSIMINQIVPSNFNEYWNMLTPLMKPEYKTDNLVKQQLLDIVSLRDKIGEACWYIYTGILLIFITQYKIKTTGCSANKESIKQSQANYTKITNEHNKKNEKLKSKIYTV